MKHAALMMLMRSDGHHEKAHRETHRTGHLSKEEAETWVRGMAHEDGTHGQKWSFAETSQLMRQKGYDLCPAEWYAVLNAMHADYCEIAKKFGVDNVDFYASMAKAWLCDEDAADDKARQYWEHVVEH